MNYKSALIKEQRKYSKEKYGPDCTVSNTKFSSVNLNELAVKARERIMVIYSSANVLEYRLVNFPLY